MTPPRLCLHCGRDRVEDLLERCHRCEREVPRSAWTRWPRTPGTIALRVVLAAIHTSITVFFVAAVVISWTRGEMALPLAARVLKMVAGSLIVAFMGPISALLWLADRWDYRGADGTTAWVQTVFGRVLEAEGGFLRVTPWTRTMPRQECELAALVMHAGASDIAVVTAAVLALWSRGGLRFAVEDRNAWKRYIHWPRSARAESPGLVVIESKRSALVTAGESGMPEGHAGRFERALADAFTFATHAEIEHAVDYSQWQRLHEVVAVAAHATGASTMLEDARSRAVGELAADPAAVRVTCGLHAGAALVALVEAEVQMGLAPA